MATKKTGATGKAKVGATADKSAGGNGDGGLSVNVREIAQFLALSTMTSRASVRARLGMSYSDERDIYTALGYTKSPTFDDYQARYERQDVAGAVINKPVQGCWRMAPSISENEDEMTAFEKATEDLIKRLRLFHYFTRVDKLASLGQYAVLFLGFGDGLEFSAPVTRAANLLYVMPYSEAKADIATYETSDVSPRYGLPLTYKINMSIGTSDMSISKVVHHTRVIHVVEDAGESNVFGTPRLQRILNRLQDLELVTGGSSEMFWRGGFPGYNFNIADDATLGEQDLSELRTQIEDYMHGLKRYLRTRGVDVESLTPQIADPSNNIDALLDLISCATNIPKRILLGSERGELASTQDEKNWAAYLDERRRNHCEPAILRPTIDRLIEVGVLPTPPQGYDVEWPDLLAPGTKEIAEVGELRSRALKNYADSIGAQDILVPSLFLETIGYTQAEIDKNEATIAENVNTVDGDDDEPPDGSE